MHRNIVEIRFKVSTTIRMLTSGTEKAKSNLIMVCSIEKSKHSENCTTFNERVIWAYR